MATKLDKKYLKLGTSTGELNSRDIPANFTPANYTPNDIAAEGNDKISAHLNGIDSYLNGVSSNANDISETSFSAANNQAAAADVTGFYFNLSNVRSFKALASVYIDATSDLFEAIEVNGMNKGSDWVITLEHTGDNSGISLSITSLGQIQYTSTNVTGFSASTIKFRAISTSV